jgi:hypothetical protein
MWRGRLTVSPGTQPGKYALAVGSQATLTSKPYMIYRVIVYPDQETRRQSSRSLVERYLGWSPWALALFFAAFLGLGFGGVYLLSQKMDKVLLEAGKAEIFRVARGEGWCNVAFGLGSRHGIQTGMQLAIINDQGQAIGEAEVLETTETDAVARVISGHDIRLGWLVSRN